MRSMLAVIAAATMILVQAVVGTALAADQAIRQETVQFAKGATSVAIKGQIKGSATVDYRVRAGAGQTLSVMLRRTNPQNYFNVNPPGSDVAMYVGQSGEDFTGMLPTDGDYVVRVYLMRPAARRNESSDYTLTIAITGQALAPRAVSTDAVVPGTQFHASASIECVPYLATAPQRCEAFVIRRAFDGSATVEIPQLQDGKRRILFVHGKAVASDAPDPIAVSRRGDVSVVRIGVDESYEIPDALVSGG